MGGSIVHMVVGLLVATSAWALTASAFDDRAAREGSSTTDTCFGQQPSIVGTRGQELVGTDGPDVVVTNGALVVTTLAGDDLLCVTGETTKAEIATLGA